MFETRGKIKLGGVKDELTMCCKNSGIGGINESQVFFYYFIKFVNHLID